MMDSKQQTKLLNSLTVHWQLSTDLEDITGISSKDIEHFLNIKNGVDYMYIRDVDREIIGVMYKLERR